MDAGRRAGCRKVVMGGCVESCGALLVCRHPRCWLLTQSLRAHAQQPMTAALQPVRAPCRVLDDAIYCYQMLATRNDPGPCLSTISRCFLWFSAVRLCLIGRIRKTKHGSCGIAVLQGAGTVGGLSLLRLRGGHILVSTSISTGIFRSYTCRAVLHLRVVRALALVCMTTCSTGYG